MKLTMAPIILLLLWLGGLGWFIAQVPVSGDLSVDDAETVIILTGGSMRVQEGMAVFAAKQSKKVLISGIGTGVTMQDILSMAEGDVAFFAAEDDFVDSHQHDDVVHDEQENMVQMVLGSMATSTFTNAYESKIFMDLNHFTSATIVTSNYHVPRTKMIFRHVMPKYKFDYHPVYSWGLLNADGLDYKAFRVIMREYNKYLFTVGLISYEKALYLWDVGIYSVYDAIVS
jgi:uncharacterized SAM-binding protein YcdF (DUF218 family)